jgi:hypothetical protein
VNRFTQSYVVGAMSGTAMVVAAVLAFVLLISVQAVRDWPGSGISIGLGHDDSGVAVGPAHKAPPGVGNPVPAVHPVVSAGAVARTAAPPASALGHRGAPSHHHGTAVDTAVGRGGVSRGSQVTGTHTRGGPPVATPVAQPAEPPAVPSSPAQPGNGNGHGAAHTKATGAGGGEPSSSSGNGISQSNGTSQGNGNSYGGPHGAAAKNVASTPTPQAYSLPASAPEAPPTESAGEGDKSLGNAYGHENEYSSPGNSEHGKSSDH